jgi:transposase
MKKHFTAEFKSKVALALIKGDQNLGQICSNYKVSSSAALRWKTQLIERASLVFSNDLKDRAKQSAQKEEELYAQIGKLQVEVDFLKKLSL